MKAVGGLLVAGVAALAIAVVPATAASRPQVITFVSIQTSTRDANSPNTVLIYDKDVAGKKQIGHDVFTCKVNGPKVLGCVAVFSLTKGTISMKTGAGTAPDASTLANPTITGGTGAYSGAHGTVALKNVNKSGTDVQVTLKLK